MTPRKLDAERNQARRLSVIADEQRAAIDESSELELRIEKVAAGGGCVARAADGRVIFVRHALPGELVRARVTAVTASYLRADAVQILESSTDRVTPPCRFAGAGRCGGCDWQHIALAAQRSLKGALVAEQLQRLAGLTREVEVEPVPGDDRGLHWRSRTRFSVNRAGHVGLHRHRSHDLEVIDECLITSSEIEQLGIEQLRWPGLRDLEAFAPAVVGTAPPDDSVGRQLLILSSGPRDVNPASLPIASEVPVGIVLDGDVLHEPRYLDVEVLHHRYRVSAGSFWQIHRGAPAMLGEILLDQLSPLPGEHALDLFAGVGLFSVLLGEAVGSTGSVISVERAATACADARHNARDLPQVVVRHEHVTEGLVRGLGTVDLVVLDPPREGAGTKLMNALVSQSSPPRKILYIACDPASFARDLKVALDARWSLTSLRALDQFPMTEHVEIVATLEPPAAGGSPVI